MYWLIIIATLAGIAIVHTVLFKLVIFQSQQLAKPLGNDVEIPTPAWSRCLASLIFAGIVFALPNAVIEFLLTSFSAPFLVQVFAAFATTAILIGILWFVFRQEYGLPARLAVMAATCFIAYSKIFFFSALCICRQLA